MASNANGAATLPREFLGWRDQDNYRVFYGARWLVADLSPTLAAELRTECKTADVVHAGLAYNWFLPVAGKLCSSRGAPLVLTPRGTLLPDARRQKALKKVLFDRLVQDRTLRRVTAFHATSRDEAEALQLLVPGARVAVIPNGVEVPGAVPERDPGAAPFVLYLGRLHPYKRVERIIAAFARAVRWERSDGRGEKVEGRRETDARSDPDGRLAAGDAPDRCDAWSLVVAGDGEAGYRRELERVASEAGVGERVRFAGQVSGGEKAGLLAQAAFVVQAPNPENFGNVVAEALAHRTPALVGHGLPWEALDQEGCGCWVDDSEEALAAGMRRLMSLSFEERRAMGERGREWMRREFSWNSVGRRMLALYEELVANRGRLVHDSLQ